MLRFHAGQDIPLSDELSDKVEIARKYRDAVRLSSTKARTALSKGEAADGVHAVVAELCRRKGLYRRVHTSPTNTVVLIVGPPAVGKGTLANLLADRLQFSRFSAGDFYRASLLNAKYAAMTDRLRTELDKWGPFLIGTAALCLKAFIAACHNTRIVVDGFDETGIEVLEAAFGGCCVDVVVSLHCASKTLLQRMEGRGRDPPEECARRIDKYDKTKEAYGKQLKSFIGSPRDMIFASIDAEPPVETYVATFKLLDKINAVLAGKAAAAPGPAPVLTTPEFVAAVVEQAYSSAEYDALEAEIEALLAAADKGDDGDAQGGQ